MISATAISENSHQSHEQVNERKENENIIFNEVQQFAYISGAERERDRILIESINYKIIKIRDNTRLYTAKESRKKRKTKILKSDQKRIQNQI